MPINLTASAFKSLLGGIISLIVVFTLGSDLFSWMEMNKNEQILQQLQIQKENIFSKKMTGPQQQTRVNSLIFLSPSEAGFTLAKICETSRLGLVKIQLEQMPVKITQNSFEVSLDLIGDYFAFIDFLNQLREFSWNIDWQTLHIVPANLKIMKKTNSQSSQQKAALYPLEIKLKLVIAYYYDANKKIPRVLQTLKLPPHASWPPFIMRRYAGKFITEGKTVDLIAAGEGKNEVLLSPTT